MSTLLQLLLVVMVAATVASWKAQAAGVEIEWLNPEEYQDIENGVDGKTAYKHKVFRALESKLTTLAEALPAEQFLRLKVYDVDLAGQVVEKQARRLREITSEQYPKLKFTYKLFLVAEAEQQEGEGDEDAPVVEGELLKAGGVNLKQVNFWDHRETLEKEFLRYEKYMLEEWFKFTFLPREPELAENE